LTNMRTCDSMYAARGMGFSDQTGDAGEQAGQKKRLVHALDPEYRKALFTNMKQRTRTHAQKPITKLMPTG
jgi:hypothetical protein